MLEKSYYKDYLNQRLTYLKGWARNADTYRGFMEIGKRVEIEIFREKPIFYTIIFFYFLPTNLLKFIDKMKRNYYYNKAIKEMEILKKEIEILKLKNKTCFNVEKKFNKL